MPETRRLARQKTSDMPSTLKDLEPLPDSTIIDHVLGGDIDAFEILIRRYNRYLYKIGRSYRYTHEDTEDLMQETFMHAYTHLPKFERRASFKTWLIRIMLNTCYHFQQRASVRKEVSHPIEEQDIPMFSDDRSLDTSFQTLSRELTHVVEAALVRIPQDYRDVFTLREMNELSVAETSALLQISESNVKVKLMRAKAMLRREIQSAYSPEDIFEFNLVYCDAMVFRVMKQIRAFGGLPKPA